MGVVGQDGFDHYTTATFSFYFEPQDNTVRHRFILTHKLQGTCVLIRLSCNHNACLYVVHNIVAIELLL